jgi:hypothetical protein
MRLPFITIIILSLLLWPGSTPAQEPQRFCRLDCKPLEEKHFSQALNVRVSKHSSSKPLPSESELSAAELDSITAGGLAHLFNRVPSGAWLLGRIILWDETGNRAASENATGLAGMLPARTMQRTQINAVFVNNQ